MKTKQQNTYCKLLNDSLGNLNERDAFIRLEVWNLPFVNGDGIGFALKLEATALEDEECRAVGYDTVVYDSDAEIDDRVSAQWGAFVAEVMACPASMSNISL